MNFLCMLGRHTYQEAHDHPDRNMGYRIVECSRCHKAMVSDPSQGGFYPIQNTQSAIARDSAKSDPRG